jgi:serine/threonine-protein kinase HipA
MPFLEKQPLVETLINHSFLNENNKRGYWQMYNTRRNSLNK